MSETRDRILMCPPDFFTVDYVINPWMAGHESSLDIKLAKRQWSALRDAIAEHADIVEVKPVKGLPDMVFTANAGFVLDGRVALARFRHAERSGVGGHHFNAAMVALNCQRQRPWGGPHPLY